MAGADGNRQRIQLSLFHEIGRLIRIGQQLITSHLGISAVSVFFVAFHGFQRTQATQFAFDADPDAMSHINNLAGHIHVIVVTGNSLAIRLQGTIHHDGRKPHANCALADRGVLAMVLVHANRDVRVGFNGSLN